MEVCERVESAPKRLNQVGNQFRNKGEWKRVRVEIRTQMSTFSSIVTPVLTSKSSGARYAIVLCSAAMSYNEC